MLLDQNTVLSDKQIITGSASSENAIDCCSAGNVVPGALFAVCRTEEGFNGVTKMTISLQTDDDASFANPAELMSTVVMAEALAEKDKVLFAIALPVGLKRFLRTYYVPSGTATAGSLSCFLTDSVDMK